MASTALRSPVEEASPGPSYAQQQTLLVVDDDVELRNLVAEQLRNSGYRVLTAGDGVAMTAVLEAHQVNLIILDLNLPGQDGLSLCRENRSLRNIPIIMLTARAEAIDRVIGLEVGADDYVSKPFDPRELAARVRSVLRRSYLPLKVNEAPPPKRARFRDWILDFENRRLVNTNGRVVMLSGAEYSLLKFLVENANQVLTREQLVTLTVTQADMSVSAQRMADLQISRLRQKVDDNARASELIMTVRGQGYVLAAPVTFE